MVFTFNIYITGGPYQGIDYVCGRRRLWNGPLISKTDYYTRTLYQ